MEEVEVEEDGSGGEASWRLWEVMISMAREVEEQLMREKGCGEDQQRMVSFGGKKEEEGC